MSRYKVGEEWLGIQVKSPIGGPDKTTWLDAKGKKYVQRGSEDIVPTFENWEYDTEYFDLSPSEHLAKSIAFHLDKRGKDGWRVVQVIQEKAVFLFILERRGRQANDE